jgi:Integrase zinc binding domain
MIEIKLLKIPNSQREREALDFAHNNDRKVVFCERSKILYIIHSKSYGADDLRSPIQAMIELCTRLRLTNLAVANNNENEKLIRELEKTKEILRKNLKVYVVPGVEIINNAEYKKLILNDFHLLPTSAHAGIKRMSKNIRKYYYWSEINKDVEQFVKQCDSCQRFKHSTPQKEPMMVTTTSNKSLNKIFMDIVGSITKDYANFSYILTMQCKLSKYILAVPLENKEAKTVARAFIEHFVLKYGIPREIGHDCGTEFIAEVMKESCKLLNVKQIS